MVRTVECWNRPSFNAATVTAVGRRTRQHPPLYLLLLAKETETVKSFWFTVTPFSPFH